MLIKLSRILVVYIDGWYTLWNTIVAISNNQEGIITYGNGLYLICTSTRDVLKMLKAYTIVLVDGVGYLCWKKAKTLIFGICVLNLSDIVILFQPYSLLLIPI